MTEPTLYPESGFLRLRLDLAYDGTQFSGWGKQPDRRTVQSELESALQKLTRTEVNTIVAGRTDAGVHAAGQVVHVDIPEQEHGPYAKKVNWNFAELPYRLNRILDEDVRVLKASMAPPDFTPVFPHCDAIIIIRFLIPIRSSCHYVALMLPLGIARSIWI